MQRQLNWSLIFVVCVMSVFIASKANAQWGGEEFRASLISTTTTDDVAVCSSDLRTQGDLQIQGADHLLAISACSYWELSSSDRLNP